MNRYGYCRTDSGQSIAEAVDRVSRDIYQNALAGHLQPLWIVDGGISELHVPGSVPLGVQKGAAFRKAEIDLQSGQSVLLFTDGLVEAENETSGQFTKGRLMDFLKRSAGPRGGKACGSTSKTGAVPVRPTTISRSWRCGGIRPRRGRTMRFESGPLGKKKDCIVRIDG